MSWDSQCKGNHNLTEIMSKDLGWGESAVVRWCTRCGAIVVDQDFDNRTNAGRFMQMIKPYYK